MSRKAQVVLSDYQYGLAEKEARDRGKSISALLREGLEVFLKEVEERRKDEALERLFNMNNPVDDWEVMKKELNERFDGWEKWQPPS